MANSSRGLSPSPSVRSGRLSGNGSSIGKGEGASLRAQLAGLDRQKLTASAMLLEQHIINQSGRGQDKYGIYSYETELALKKGVETLGALRERQAVTDEFRFKQAQQAAATNREFREQSSWWAPKEQLPAGWEGPSAVVSVHQAYAARRARPTSPRSSAPVTPVRGRSTSGSTARLTTRAAPAHSSPPYHQDTNPDDEEMLPEAHAPARHLATALTMDRALRPTSARALTIDRPPRSSAPGIATANGHMQPTGSSTATGYSDAPFVSSSGTGGMGNGLTRPPLASTSSVRMMRVNSGRARKGNSMTGSESAGGGEEAGVSSLPNQPRYVFNLFQQVQQERERSVQGQQQQQGESIGARLQRMNASSSLGAALQQQQQQQQQQTGGVPVMQEGGQEVSGGGAAAWGPPEEELAEDGGVADGGGGEAAWTAAAAGPGAGDKSAHPGVAALRQGGHSQRSLAINAAASRVTQANSIAATAGAVALVGNVRSVYKGGVHQRDLPSEELHVPAWGAGVSGEGRPGTPGRRGTGSGAASEQLRSSFGDMPRKAMSLSMALHAEMRPPSRSSSGVQAHLVGSPQRRGSMGGAAAAAPPPPQTDDSEDSGPIAYRSSLAGAASGAASPSTRSPMPPSLDTRPSMARGSTARSFRGVMRTVGGGTGSDSSGVASPTPHSPDTHRISLSGRIGGGIGAATTSEGGGRGRSGSLHIDHGGNELSGSGEQLMPTSPAGTPTGTRSRFRSLAMTAEGEARRTSNSGTVSASGGSGGGGGGQYTRSMLAPGSSAASPARSHLAGVHATERLLRRSSSVNVAIGNASSGDGGDDGVALPERSSQPPPRGVTFASTPGGPVSLAGATVGLHVTPALPTPSPPTLQQHLGSWVRGQSPAAQARRSSLTSAGEASHDSSSAAASTAAGGLVEAGQVAPGPAAGAAAATGAGVASEHSVCEMLDLEDRTAAAAALAAANAAARKVACRAANALASADGAADSNLHSPADVPSSRPSSRSGVPLAAAAAVDALPTHASAGEGGGSYLRPRMPSHGYVATRDGDDSVGRTLRRSSGGGAVGVAVLPPPPLLPPSSARRSSVVELIPGGFAAAMPARPAVHVDNMLSKLHAVMDDDSLDAVIQSDVKGLTANSARVRRGSHLERAGEGGSEGAGDGAGGHGAAVRGHMRTAAASSGMGMAVKRVSAGGGGKGMAERPSGDSGEARREGEQGLEEEGHVGRLGVVGSAASQGQNMRQMVRMTTMDI